eukprot:CAMPEP_0116114204 /NCGR_PEP_ID=MMETSP0327-20121206/19902_1 /TAXON_ID=44447 /ORGANISM="Pseudo-nitzschia delicatissima, Strain B596" /LENGTH=470 /DNA_ID=CAMNT_0003607583 /DNA_START=122 /DNA_END=1535 /DNA_ORIENTATION=+
MTFSSVRTALQKNSRQQSKALSSLPRSLSTTTPTASSDSSSDGGQKQQRRRLIPTQHSSKGPPPVCRDATELQELTQELLESPVGSLFCQGTIKTSSSSAKASSSISDDRDEAYGLAHESSEKVEYLLRGYNRNVSPLTLCSNSKTAESDPATVSASLETMMDVLERLHREGEMYLQLRREASNYSDSSDSDSSTDGSSSSNDSSDSESESDDDHGDDDPRFSTAVKDKLKVDARDQQQKVRSGNHDFAIPGVTTAMYDTILDAMACATESGSSPAGSFLQTLEPDDIYHVAGAAWKAHDLNNQSNSGDMFFAATTPTMVTYNATLRGIGNICLSSTSEEERKALITDQGLAHGFGVYNQLTHNDHGLPKRNGASIVYLLNIIKACIPPSRTRGNMTVALWHQASMEGLVTPELIQSVKELHEVSNGPEFDVFLESLDKCTASGSSSDKVVITPQRFARFAKKYSYSKFY